MATCPWRNGISGSYWQFKKTAAVFIPPIIIDIYNIIMHPPDRCSSVAAGVTAMLVVIALVRVKFAFQIRRSPEKGLVQ